MNYIEELEFKLEKKILGFRNMQEKLENIEVSSCMKNVFIFVGVYEFFMSLSKYWVLSH